MTLFRSIRLTIAVAAIALFSHGVVASEAEPPVSDDGLYTQPWFKHDSFLELKDDLAEAHAGGKRLAILWEQRGCPYCREMHRVNFAKPAISDYIKANFDVIQLNMWGDREVVDTDGEALTEKQLARKWRVSFTPTTVFLGEDGKEVFRMPGYFKPFHFVGVYRYVAEKGYEEEGLQRWLQDYADKLEAEGKSIDLWAN
jgi:thioredoxin-related protein